MQDHENQKNLLLAIVLSVAVLLGWQFFYAAPRLKEEQDRQARLRRTGADEDAGAGRNPAHPRRAPDAVPGTTPAGRDGTGSHRRSADPRGGAAGEPAPADRDAERQRVDRRSRAGGSTTSCWPSTGRRSTRSSPNVVLFSPSGSPHPFYAEYGWIAGSRRHPADAGRRDGVDASRRADADARAHP